MRAVSLKKKGKATAFLAAAALAALPALPAALGCNGGEETTDTSGTTHTTPPISQTILTATTPTSSGITVPPPPSQSQPPAPSPSPQAAPAPLRIVDYSVDPNSVHAGAALSCIVTVEGEAAAVRMGLTGPSGSTPQTVNLTRGSTSGGITTWSAVTTAPVTVGGWRFGATAVATDGTEVIPNAGGLSASLLPFEVIP